MATNFPTSIDTFTNPTSANTLDFPSHSQQHSDANDAIEAIETKVGIGASPASSASAGQLLTAQGGGTATWQSLTSLTNTAITNPSITNGTVTTAVFIAPEESITISATPSSGTVSLDFASSGATFATANATANWVLNCRGGVATTLNSLLSVGQSYSHVYLNTNGTGIFYPTAFQVDGSSVTPRWQAAGTPTAGNASSVDAYSLTINECSFNPNPLFFAIINFFIICFYIFFVASH
jgi:hypothetical protein